MRILYLTDQFYQHGGIEKILSQKINYLIEHYNFEVILCTSEQKGNKFIYNISEKIIFSDLEINYIRDKSYYHPLNLFKSIKHFSRLKKFIKQQNPDVIVSANFTPEQFMLPFIEKNIPKIKEFHSSGYNNKDGTGIAGKIKKIMFSLFEKYDSVVVLNELEKTYYPFSNLSVIPNFIKIPIVKQEYIREKVIISAGRIASIKQFDHLMKAWELIESDFPLWQVHVYGSGDENLLDEYMAYINEKDIKRIAFMGSVDNLNEIMQKATLFAMTSASECFPMVLLEAMSCGLPIISYDCPNGPRSIIKNGVDGVLTKHNDIDMFASELKNMLLSQNLIERMGENAKENVISFNDDVVMNKWIYLFNKLTIK